MIRPPPGATPPQRARTSAPQAERKTNSSSRGNIGRNTSAGAAAGAAAAGAPATAGAAAAPVAAATAFWQLADSFVMLFSRHCNAGAPPVGTPAQTFG